MQRYGARPLSSKRCRLLSSVWIRSLRFALVSCLETLPRPWLLTERSEYTTQEIARGTEAAFEELGHMEKTVKRAREAILDINRSGQEIHTHLAWEPELSSARQYILGKHTDKSHIERAVQVHCCLACVPSDLQPFTAGVSHRRWSPADGASLASAGCCRPTH
jgi:hypothetical protein